MDKFDEKIIGYEATKNILRQILDTLKRPEIYKSKGASIPRGLLMESDPGLGKSLLATVFIKEAGRKSLVFRKTSQENSFLDELRAAFLAAKEAAPSILLLEDLNLYVESNSPYAPEWACLQACIDDAKSTDLFVIATTNDTKYIEDLKNFGAQEYFNGNAPHDLQMLGIKGSVIEFGAADKKFANANHPNKIVRCIFNNIHICPTQSYYYNHGSWKVLGTENQSNFMISVKIFEYEKFDYPRAVVSDCSFTNCFAASDSLINEYFDFKPVFSKNRYYRLIRQENNYGLNNMRNPSDFVESNNVKLKETNASGKKIGSSMPVEWDDSEYTTCKMATTWLNTFNKA